MHKSQRPLSTDPGQAQNPEDQVQDQIQDQLPRSPHIRPRPIPRNGQEWVNRRINFNQKQIKKKMKPRERLWKITL